MVTGSVVAKDWRKRPSWKLKPPCGTQAQGIVVSGFATLPAASALFLEFTWPDERGGGAWLKALTGVAPVTDADGREERTAALAFTWTGLARMGLSEEALGSFSGPFREGMCQEDRLRRLGDKVDDVWQHTVVESGYHWSANIPPRPPIGDAPEERRVTTALTVHALLLLYEKDEAAVAAWAAEVGAALKPHGVRTVRTLPLDLRPDATGIGYEHFGFADGLSQPIPYQEGIVIYGDGRDVERDRWHGVPLGEILIGHTDAHHEVAPGPMVRCEEDDAKSGGLKAAGAPAGFLNFGLNGSYMVVRELKQDVADFWHSLDEATERIRTRDPQHSGHVTSDWLAERVIGRDKAGHLLCPKSTLGFDEFNQPQNAFGFVERDPHGQGCPLGSHVRRANPRDSLAKDAASAETLLDAANSHRILRRGRKYGTTLADPREDDGADRGLLFICLNTDIARQFEFVQQTWLLNSNFHTLFDETDPLVGPKGPMTISETPLRRRIEVDTFVQCAGGDYFFLPSMPALAYLAAL